jgi:hypothetical protein
MLAKINKITSWQAALVIAVVGFAVYFTGLATPFQGDDTLQIVNNIPVHSITHLKVLFEGGTFYNGHGLAPLAGSYYRPLMMVMFSLLYTLFGPHSIYFHLFQLMLYIGSAIILHLFFRYSFKPALALALALVFLVHPINSQDVFSIAGTQEVLFFFFGILALYLLIRFQSIKSLLLVALCLFLSLLSKESGILFVAMAAIYLFWFDRRKRLYTFVGTMVLPAALYLILKMHAVGLLGANPHNAPIDSLNLTHRLMTAPSIVLFYLTKFIFPWKLATAYHWVYPTFSVSHVLIPLIVDLAVVALVVYTAFLIHRKATKAQLYSFVFFAIWAALGLLLTLQIIPLDVTATERYFIYPMIGLLGMAGIVLTVFPPRIRPRWILLVIAALVIGVLGVRTALRGLDYRNQYTLAYKDISASPQDYNAYKLLAADLDSQGNYSVAATYAQRSVSIFPTPENYYNLGLALEGQGDLGRAFQAFSTGLHYGNYYPLCDSLAPLIVAYSGNQASGLQFFSSSLKLFPQDSTLWMYLAIFEATHSNNAEAKIAISQAARYGQVNQTVYDDLMTNKPFVLNIPDVGKSIRIP